MRAVSTRDLMAVVHCWMYDVWLSTDCISRSKVVDHLMSWLTTGAVVSIAASPWLTTGAVVSIAASPCAPEAALATSAASERADGLESATGFAMSGFFSTFGFFLGDGAIADYRDGGTLR